MAKWCRVAGSSDIEPGGGRVVRAGDHTIALFNVDGVFHAIDNTCVHAGGPLGEGDLQGTTVLCPWHGWGYDVTSGEATHDPDTRLSCFAVKVAGDDILVEVPESD
jgi:nitrite reductase/ring-hydroxylating ferredoxin subunit